MSENQQIKSIIESLLFVSEKPLMLEQIKDVLEGVDIASIRQLIAELKSDYQAKACGMDIVEVAGGFQMCTSSSSAPYLKKFYKIKHAEKLTMPTLETLAIVAYKQPVTRIEIESIRGVNVDGVIKSLTDKGMIRIAGRRDSPGRPFVYGTTRLFLEYFGLKSLDELPKIEEFVKAAAKAQEEKTEEKTEDNTEDNTEAKIEEKTEEKKEEQNESTEPAQENR
jgi:segregation and condensation protein B